MTVVSVFVGLLAKERRQSELERVVGRKLEAQDCSVAFIGPYDSRALQDAMKPQGWWRDLARMALGERISTVSYGSDRESIKLLVGLANLEELHIRCTAVSDLTPLTKMTNLRSLTINCTYVKDLSPLVELTSLEKLYVYEIYVTDLNSLSQLENLKVLRLHGEAISAKTVESLRQALPDCEIDG